MRGLAAILLLALAGTAQARGVTLPEPRIVRLDNGAVLIVHEKDDVPLVGLSATIRGGAVSDPDGKAGLASLVAGLLEKGAGDRDAAAFAEAVDAVGGSLSVSAGLETVTISAEFMARDAGLMLDLVADMLQRPRFERGEVDKLRDRRIDLIAAAKDGGPQGLMPVYGTAFLFRDHPYGTAIDGDETSLAGLSAADVRRYYEAYFGANRLVVAVVGAIDADATIGRLADVFGGWRTVDGPLPDIAEPAPESGRRVLLVDKPGATQTYFWIGNVGVARDFDRRAELDIANTLFGGRFTSLLVDEMRTKAGLTYSVRSALSRPSEPGSVAIVSFTKTESTVEAIDLALQLLGRMREEGFSDTLVASAKNYILGQFPPGLETSAQLADVFAELATFGLDKAYIDDYGGAVDAAAPATINEVIGRVYPAVDDLVIAVIGDAAEIRDTVAEYGPLTEMAMSEPRFSP